MTGIAAHEPALQRVEACALEFAKVLIEGHDFDKVESEQDIEISFDKIASDSWKMARALCGDKADSHGEEVTRFDPYWEGEEVGKMGKGAGQGSRCRGKLSESVEARLQRLENLHEEFLDEEELDEEELEGLGGLEWDDEWGDEWGGDRTAAQRPSNNLLRMALEEVDELHDDVAELKTRSNLYLSLFRQISGHSAAVGDIICNKIGVVFTDTPTEYEVKDNDRPTRDHPIR